MAKFKIITPKGASFTVAGGGYEYEMEPLEGMDAEMVEGPTDEDGFIAAAKDADALYAKGIPITKRIIDGLERCKIIALGSVGVDQVDVAAATARGIPVTNCPDTFIEEVADHAMALLLASFRRVIEQDRMVREGRWSEGRPALLQIPRLMGQTLGFIAFGNVARAVARRAKPFGLRMIAYDPFIEELVMPDYDVVPASLEEVLKQSDFISIHAPATPEAQGMLKEKHFRLMKKTAIFINVGRGPTVDEVSADQGAAGGMDRPCRPGRAGEGAPRPQQPAADNEQRDLERAQRFGLGALRSGAQAPRRRQSRDGAQRSVAGQLRQSGSADAIRSTALATDLHAARTEQLKS